MPEQSFEDLQKKQQKIRTKANRLLDEISSLSSEPEWKNSFDLDVLYDEINAKMYALLDLAQALEYVETDIAELKND